MLFLTFYQLCLLIKLYNGHYLRIRFGFGICSYHQESSELVGLNLIDMITAWVMLIEGFRV